MSSYALQIIFSHDPYPNKISIVIWTNRTLLNDVFQNVE